MTLSILCMYVCVARQDAAFLVTLASVQAAAGLLGVEAETVARLLAPAAGGDSQLVPRLAHSVAHALYTLFIDLVRDRVFEGFF